MLPRGNPGKQYFEFFGNQHATHDPTQFLSKFKYMSIFVAHISMYVQFQEILKPNYNSVDLAEVELVAGNEYINEPRANDSELLEVSYDHNFSQFSDTDFSKVDYKN